MSNRSWEATLDAAWKNFNNEMVIIRDEACLV